MASATSLLALLLVDGREAIAAPIVGTASPYGGGGQTAAVTDSTPQSVTRTYTFASGDSPVTGTASTTAIILDETSLAQVLSSPATDAAARDVALVRPTLTSNGNRSLPGTSIGYNLNGSLGAGNSVFTSAASMPVVTTFGMDTTTGASPVTTTLTGTTVAAVTSVSNTIAFSPLGSFGDGNLAGTGTSYNLNRSVANTAPSPDLTAGTSNLSQSVVATVTSQRIGPTYQSLIQGGPVDTPAAVANGAVGPASSTISFGSVGYKASQTIDLVLQNTATNPGNGNANLTNLTIEKYSITGANASAFSIPSLSPGSVIAKGSTLLVPILLTGTSNVGTLNSTLTIFTDESAALDGAGDTFTYALVGYSVPEPASITVLGAGFAGLASLRRRRRTGRG